MLARVVRQCPSRAESALAADLRPAGTKFGLRSFGWGSMDASSGFVLMASGSRTHVGISNLFQLH